MEAALGRVRAQLGRQYQLLIAGERVTAPQQFDSRDPAQPSRVVGVHQKATAEMAVRAIEDAHAYFDEWARTPIESRVEMLVRAADLMRQRKFEFNSWMVFEAGKSWAEAEADTSEAIDFCEYYARQMLKWGNPDPLLQLPGEKDQLRYLPLGVGVVIPPWNFPLAITCGMTAAALVAGNTVVLKPSSDTPTIAAQLVDVLLEAGIPRRALNFLTGSGTTIGDVIVEHPKTRFVSFTGSREVGLHINQLAAKPQRGQIWIKRVVAEMGGKDAIVVDAETDVDTAVEGVLVSAFGYQGQKCSACSRAIVDRSIYNEFVEKLKARVETLKVGSPEDPSNYMGPVINAGAKRTILEYIEKGQKEGGRLIAGGEAIAGEEGHFIKPTVIADVADDATIFQEEIFGPVLAITPARDFDHALELANSTEYGLTGAVYTNNREKIEKAAERFHVGNLYINRKCTGAMVGAHPFGGFNMSGTDSKAGGPDYLLQFLQAKAIAEKIS